MDEKLALEFKAGIFESISKERGGIMKGRWQKMRLR